MPWSMGKLQTMLSRLKLETGVDGRLVLVDDGSRDNTWQLIEQFAHAHNNVVGISLHTTRDTRVLSGLVCKRV